MSALMMSDRWNDFIASEGTISEKQLPGIQSFQKMRSGLRVVGRARRRDESFDSAVAQIHEPDSAKDGKSATRFLTLGLGGE